MKFLHTLSQKILFSILGFLFLAGIVYGVRYGVNKLGGVLFNDESLVCPKKRSHSRLKSLTFTDDGQTFITGGHSIKFWDVPTGNKQGDFLPIASPISSLANPSFSVSALVITQDQQSLISAISSLEFNKNMAEIQLWDLTTRQLIGTLSGHNNRIPFLTVSPDSKTLLSQDNDGVIHLWDLSTRQLKTTIKTQTDKRFPIALSPDGQTFATIKDSTITFWDLNTGDSLSQMKAHPSHTPLALSANNKTLLLQNAGDVKRFKDINTGAEQLMIQGSLVENPFARTPDGQHILIQTDSGIKLYNFETGAELNLFSDIKYTREIKVSPNGRSFLTLDSRGKFTLRALKTGSMIFELEGRIGEGTYGFTPDSQFLVHFDRFANDVTIWDLDTGKRIRRFCHDPYSVRH